MAKHKTKKQEFVFLKLPAKLLAMSNISMIEKCIAANVGYFNGDGYPGYTESNAGIAKKFGSNRRTVINAIKRLRAKKMIKDVGVDKYHRCLKLNGELSVLFEGVKSERITLPDKAKKFQKPTAQEVSEYAASIGFQLDGERFVSHYDSNGWKVGRNKMKDWRACVRTWKSRDNKNGTSKNIGSNQPAEPYIR